MSTIRSASTAFLLLTLGTLFAGCLAAGKPPDSYASAVECTSNLQCKFIAIPACTRNMKQCYEGHCLISDIPGCVVPAIPVTAAPTATATVPIPAPTPATPSPNPTPAAPN